MELEAEKGDSGYQVGESVVVKPVNRRCTSRWTEGVVTGIVSRNNVEVDGMPRHVLDIRHLVGEEDGEGRAASDRPLKLNSGQRAAGAGENNLHVLR